MLGKSNSSLKTSRKTGLPPGTPFFVGDVKVEETTLSLISFNKSGSKVQKFEDFDISKVETTEGETHWLNTNGLHETKTIQGICKKWNIHELIIEDIVNTNHRPKVEIYDDYVFLVAKMYSYDSASKSVITEQVSFILIDNTVLSFQERPGDVFGPLRERIKNNKGRVRKLGADYLFYSLLDCLVDSYFGLLEEIDNDLEAFEEGLLTNTSTATLSSFFSLKRSLLLLKKSVWPLREITTQLARGESELIKESTEPYLRDLYEHVIQVIDTVETFRDLASGVTDMYLSIVNNKMNEVMKVLTVCASIFIPLTFIAGIYGMNFEYMPELKWQYSYFVLLGVMGFIVIVMLMFFKKKKWI